MTPKIIVGADNACLKLVCDKFEIEPREFFPCTTIGVMVDNELALGVIYHQYKQTRKGSMVEVSAAASSAKWSNRDILHELFYYPFRELQVTRLQALCSVENTHANKVVRKLGFVFEGVARNAWDGYLGANIYSMLPNECKWLRNG